MFLVVHASLGAILGNAIGEPAPALVVGMGSHFVLDMVPHGDEVIGRQLAKGNYTKLLAALAVIDCLGAFSIVTLFWLAGLLPQAVGAFSGALGAVLPDVFAGLSEVSKGKLWPRYAKLHERNHRLLGREVSFVVGGLLQFLTLLTFWLYRASLIF